jgi:hypothetical protein
MPTDPPRGRGRPRKAPGAPATPPAPRERLWLRRGTLARLLAVASRQGLTHGGLPSATRAVEWLLEQRGD